jgi:hypothetical protein
MAGYSDTRQLIIDTLMGRPSGTEIQPEDHQAFALALNDYIRNVELVAGSGVPVAFAEPDTVPIQPNNGQAVYLSQVPCDSSKTFSNFIGQDGNALRVSSVENEVKLVTLLWNGSYWSKQETSIPVVTDTTSGFVFKGVAKPDTVPSGMNIPCFYISSIGGVYENFGNINISFEEVAILKTNDGSSWVKEVLNIPNINSVATFSKFVASVSATWAFTEELKRFKGESKVFIRLFHSISGVYLYDNKEKKMRFPENYKDWMEIDLSEFTLPRIFIPGGVYEGAELSLSITNNDYYAITENNFNESIRQTYLTFNGIKDNAALERRFNGIGEFEIFSESYEGVELSLLALNYYESLSGVNIRMNHGSSTVISETIETDGRPTGVQKYRIKVNDDAFIALTINWDVFDGYSNSNANEIFVKAQGFNQKWYDLFQNYVEFEVSRNNGIIRDISFFKKSRGILDFHLWDLSLQQGESLENSLVYLDYASNTGGVHLQFYRNNALKMKNIFETESRPTGTARYKFSWETFAVDITIDWDAFKGYSNVNANEIFFLMYGRDADYICRIEGEELVTKEELNESFINVQDYPTRNVINASGTLDINQVLGNNIPATLSGFISSIIYRSSGSPFNLLVAEKTPTGGYQALSRTTILPENPGLEEKKGLNIPIEVGQYVLFEQKSGQTPAQHLPYFTTANADYASLYTNGWLQAGSMTLNEPIRMAIVENGCVACFYKVISPKFSENVTITTTEITVERNAEDYNSIRNLLSTLSPSYYNRYIVKVPKGRWFECDLLGVRGSFDYLKIVGEDMFETIIYCDGTSDKLTPTDYSVSGKGGQPLNSMSRIYKHCVNVLNDIQMAGLTIEATNCKYCVHFDRAGVHKGKFVNCRFVALEDTQQPVGIGLHNSQELILEKCSFIPLKGFGVYCHNDNNCVDSSRLSIKDSYFKYDYLVLGELGSERNAFINLNNCVSGKDDATMSIYVESKKGGVSYWNDPETGEPTTDLTQVPYNLMINVVGTDVHGVSLINRPRALDYIVGKIL